jgi:hypothetical protein
MNAVAMVLFIPVFLLVVAMIAARIFLSREICWPVIEAWAAREGFVVEDDEVDPFFADHGPFLFRTSSGQKVYRLRVRYRGEQRIAYARCGHWLFGLLKPTLTIRWKEEPNKAPEPTPTSVMPAAEQPSRRP